MKDSSVNPMQNRLKIIQENLYGVDFNLKAIISCREKVKKWIIGSYKKNLNNNQIKTIDEIVDSKIRSGNILVGNIFPKGSNSIENEDKRKEKNLFNWNDQFPDIFNKHQAGFDIILCNPPYVTKDLPQSDIKLYRELYKEKIVVNRLNLYHLFFARVTDLLHSNGIATFLTANSVLTDRFSIKLREYLLANFQLSSIIDFVSRNRIFPNVLQGTCILTLSKKKTPTNQYKTQVIRTFDIDSLNKGIIENHQIPIKNLLHFNKIVPSPFSSTFKIIKMMNKHAMLLKDIVKIQSGEIRPADKNIRPFYFKELQDTDSSSQFDIILNGKNVHPFCVNLTSKRQKPRWYFKRNDSTNEIYRKKHAMMPRIVIQRITAREQLRRVISGIITDKDIDKNNRIWVENNLNYILLDSKILNPHLGQNVLLGLFNSLLINWYIHQINLTAAIPPADLGLIPLPKYNPRADDDWMKLDRKVSQLQNIIKHLSNSSEILTALCPVCSPNEKISKLRSEIDTSVFQLYELPDKYEKEVLYQLTLHHNYFNHH